MNRFAQCGAAWLLFQLAACEKPAERAATPAVAQTAAAPVAAPGEARDTKLVVALGDSLFAGYNLGPSEGFAPALQRGLAARGVVATVVNAGVSGDTSAAGRARLGYVLDGLARKPDLVIVGLGANDMLRGLDPAATRANLAAILAELKRRGIPAMLTGMVASRNLGARFATPFDAIYPALAKEYDAPLNPFFLDGVITERALLLPDGLHPNKTGIERIVGKIAPQVADALGA